MRMPDVGPLPTGRAALEAKTRQAAGRLAAAVRQSVVGESPATSTFAVALGVVLAAASAWAVGTTIGIETLADRVLETLSGQAIDTAVLQAGAALVALAALAALAGAGLLPAVLLGSGPVFGAAVTRYGAEYEFLGSTHTISLMEASLDAAGAALVVGAPLAVAGFALGVAVRRVVASARGQF